MKTHEGWCSMKAHLVQAHERWRSWIRPGDLVVDATVGNGHDTYFLAGLLQGQGSLTGYDIQAAALLQTQKRVEQLPESFKKIITLKQQSHQIFSETNVKLFVYNLGYLPGGAKSLTTQSEITLLSLKSALENLSENGAISITCYPGHPEGLREQQAILDFLSHLSFSWEKFSVNRPSSPTWIWLQAGPGA